MPRARLNWAIVLAVASVAISVALLLADTLAAGIGWSHHPGVSAAALLIIAGALAVATLAHARTVGSAVKALVGVAAFAAWGLGQLAASPTLAGLLGDVAILLFVFDAAYIIVSDARGFLDQREKTESVTAPHTGRLEPGTWMSGSEAGSEPTTVARAACLPPRHVPASPSQDGVPATATGSSEGFVTPRLRLRMNWPRKPGWWPRGRARPWLSSACTHPRLRAGGCCRSAGYPRWDSNPHDREVTGF